jgi:REP element-mobilizing transposase RayT
MPRSARKKSSTGIYHIVFRGINKQRIFEEKEDYLTLLEKLHSFQETSRYEIYAYCLMSNHVHLLMKEGTEEFGLAFRRIGTSYVHWFNKKYERCGHLFQDRYKSEPVEKDSYLLTVIRYIHQNPVKAGLVKKIQEYPWSSYQEYIHHKPLTNNICNTAFIFSFFSEDPEDAEKHWIDFNQTISSDSCLDYDIGTRWVDSEAEAFIKKTAKVKYPSELQSFEKQKRNRMIKILKEKGISIRQIERLTGISFGIIRKV